LSSPVVAVVGQDRAVEAVLAECFKVPNIKLQQALLSQ
jgi:hypothetical protein